MTRYRIARLGTLEKYRIEYLRQSLLFGDKWKPKRECHWPDGSSEIQEYDSHKEASDRVRRLKAIDLERDLRNSKSWVVAP